MVYVRLVQFRILGPLVVWNDGREVPIAAAKQRAVLAVLLLRRGGLVPTELLVEEVWGEQAPETAVKAVRVYVSQLRKTLGQEVLETRPAGYALRLAPDELDAARFEGLIRRARELLGAAKPVEAAALLREALALWRGPPLADFGYEPFAREEIGRLEELHLDARELRIEADLALGRHAELVAELEATRRRAPAARASCAASCMLALYRSGRQADALAAYRAARETLVADLGIEPGPALRRLERAILDQDPELDARTVDPSVGRNRPTDAEPGRALDLLRGP